MKRNNPYHSTPTNYRIILEQRGVIGALERDVDALVRLELAAEQLLAEEVDLAKAYLQEDSQHVWADLKQELHYWEQATGNWLLGAADPSQLNWQRHHWWGKNQSPLH